MPEERTVFMSYTHALRHPVIIGHVAGWRLPWALSATQLGAVAATAAIMLVARPLWAHFGAVGNILAFCAVVAGAGWAVRHWRIEGRSPLRAAAAVTAALVAPGTRRGVRNGRPVPKTGPVRGSQVGLAMTEGADHG